MVHFVGAGSGAVDLITVRGAEFLKKADVVIYAGSLVNPEVLKYCRSDSQIYNSAEMDLEEIINVIKSAEDRGLNTVRLHTGDPSIYGAIKEQMVSLDESGIEYDTCPGVSACFGAAASLDLEYTLPCVSQTLIITRMQGRTEVPDTESIESLASHKASMAIYLSAGMLDELSRRLMDGGYTEDTPAALCYKATWPDEKNIICTVGTLSETAKENNITKTAVVLVGDVIGEKQITRSKLYSPDFSTEFRDAKNN